MTLKKEARPLRLERILTVFHVGGARPDWGVLDFPLWGDDLMRWMRWMRCRMSMPRMQVDATRRRGQFPLQGTLPVIVLHALLLPCVLTYSSLTKRDNVAGQRNDRARQGHSVSRDSLPAKQYQVRYVSTSQAALSVSGRRSRDGFSASPLSGASESNVSLSLPRSKSPEK